MILSTRILYTNHIFCGADVAFLVQFDERENVSLMQPRAANRSSCLIPFPPCLVVSTAMAMSLPPPPHPPLGQRGRLVGVAAPSPSASQTHRPMLPASVRLPRCRCHRSDGSWRTTTTNGRRRRWWSDEDIEDEEEDDEEYEYDGGGLGGSARQLFDEPWFSKLFRAYGYVLPLLLASMLVATGPRAFLMAMALPLAQSAVSWVVSFFTNSRRRQQQEEPYGYEYGYDDDDDPAFRRREEDDDDDYYYERGGACQWQSRSYQESSKSSGAGFGGWDDLLRDEEEKQRESTGKRRTPPEPDTAAAAAASDVGLRTSRGRRRSNGGMSAARGGRSSSSRRYNQAPLLTRLLVALFPFLGSWFRIL